MDRKADAAALNGSRPATLPGLIGLLLLSAVAWFYVQAIDTQVTGFIHDDGVYAITGKALATGHGFTLLHVPGQPAEVKYPFMLPLLLALGWLVHPVFPENLPIFVGMMVACAVVSFWLLQDYLKRFYAFPGWLANLVMLLSAFNFYVFYYGTVVMSEAPYMLFSLGTLWLAQDRLVRRQSVAVIDIALVALLSGFAFLTRVPGIALIGAIFVWLLLQKRFRSAVIYAGIVTIVALLPWFLWVKLMTPALDAHNYPLVNTYANYGFELFSHMEVSGYQFGNVLYSINERFLESMLEFVFNGGRIYPAMRQFFDKFAFTAASFGWVFCLAWQGGSALFDSLQSPRRFGAFYSIPALYIVFYITLIMAWNYNDQMGRFLAVISPLLWIYLLKPLVPNGEFPPRTSPYIQGSLLVFSLGLFFWPALHGNEAIARALLLLLSGGAAVYLMLRQPESGKERLLKQALQLVAILLICVLAAWPMNQTNAMVQKKRQGHFVEGASDSRVWDEYKAGFAWLDKHARPDDLLAVRSDVVFYLYTGHPTFYFNNAVLEWENGKILDRSYPRLMACMRHYGVRYLVVEPQKKAAKMTSKPLWLAEKMLELYPGQFRKVWQSERGTLIFYQLLPEKG